MKKISFNCNNESASLFVEVLIKLNRVSCSSKSRKIRIGGDEYDFINGIDGLQDIAVDDVLYQNMSSTEQRDLQVIRSNSLQVTSAPLPTPSDVVDNTTVTPTPAPVSFSNPAVDTDEDDDLLNSAEAVAVKDVVSSKVTQSQMFTAFDITKELRTNGNQVHHRNVKQIVHALYNNGDMQGYDRSLIDINGAPVRPFLYHPITSDPSTYQA